MKISRFKDNVKTIAKNTAGEFYSREKRYIRRNIYTWAAIFAAAILIPGICGASWWVWLFIVMASVVIPPIVMFHLAKIRYIGYIRLTRGVVTGITSSNMWQLLKTIRKAK